MVVLPSWCSQPCARRSDLSLGMQLTTRHAQRSPYFRHCLDSREPKTNPQSPKKQTKKRTMSPRNTLMLVANQAPRATPRAPPAIPAAPFTSIRGLSTITKPLLRPTITTQTFKSNDFLPHPRYYIQPPQGKPRAPSSNPNPPSTFTTTTTIPKALPLSSLLIPAFYRLKHAMYPPEDENGRRLGPRPRLRWYLLLLKSLYEGVLMFAVLRVWQWSEGRFAEGGSKG